MVISHTLKKRKGNLGHSSAWKKVRLEKDPELPEFDQKIPNRRIPNNSVIHIEPKQKLSVRVLVFNLPSFKNPEPNWTIFIYN